MMQNYKIKDILNAISNNLQQRLYGVYYLGFLELQVLI